MSVMYGHDFKYPEGEARRNTEMDSNIGHLQQHCHQHNSGLLSYRSATSSLLTSFVDNNIGCLNEEAFRSEDHQHYHQSSSSEMETMLAKLISSTNSSTNSETLNEFGGKPVKQEGGDTDSQGQQHNGYYYGSQSQLVYQTQQIQGLPNGSVGASGNTFGGSFNAVRFLDSEDYKQTKMGSSDCSNLIRQKSSPAGFFNNYSIDNGCDVSNGQVTTSTSGLHGTMNFSSRPSSCTRRMPQIVENEYESLQANGVESRRNIGNDNGNNKCYMPSSTSDLWDGSSFIGPKTASNNGEIMFSTTNALETQEADFGYQNFGLSHHLSLPSSFTKIASIEKFYQIQGSVPCKIRAKRGFATHPRSIAERERRTRISARIKKLEDLFPKSDKQTSTSDLLDLTVEYIKDLQKQVKILTETRTRCTCTSN